MTRTLHVSTPQGSYDVVVGTGLLERAHELIPAPEGIELLPLVMDDALNETDGPRGARYEALRRSLGNLGAVSSISVQGEKSKSSQVLAMMWNWMAMIGAHRNDLVVAFGGGVTGDLAGFVAATYGRGLRWCVVPTTLLAMVDSSIGGKTGIDLDRGKNLVGAFHQPAVVISDVSTLETLPAGEMATGMAEAIKHGLIDDISLLDRIGSEDARIQAREPALLEELVAQAAAVKVRIVNDDVGERGARAFLNYGHTVGHALEALGEYTRWTHGQAISIGMMFVAHLAPMLGFADRVAEHRDALERQQLPVAGADFPFEDVAHMFAYDKKYDHGMRLVVLEDLGKPTLVRDVPEDVLRAAYEKVK